MVKMSVLELSILLHVISDFLIQTDKTVKLRNREKFGESVTGNARHSIFVFLITGAGLLCFVIPNSQLLFYCLSIAFSHFLIDLVKCRLIRKNKSLDLKLFIFDQSLHIIVIFILWCLFDLKFNYSFVNIFLECSKTQMFEKHFNISINSNIIVFLIIYIYIIIGADIFICLFLKKVKDKSKIYNKDDQTIEHHLLTEQDCGKKYIDLSKRVIEENDTDESSDLRSKYIGYIERTIVFFLVIYNQIPSIAILLTAKSIARYPELNKNHKLAQKFLIGTLTSILIAIIGGIIFKGLLIK